jgi:hypothetical protein
MVARRVHGVCMCALYFLAHMECADLEEDVMRMRGWREK